MIKTKELIERWPLIDEETRQQLLGAISKTGKYKGYLLANAPNVSRKEAHIAWQVIMLNVAPSRLGVRDLMASGQSSGFADLSDKIDKGKLGAAIRVVEPVFRWDIPPENLGKLRVALEQWLDLRSPKEEG